MKTFLLAPILACGRGPADNDSAESEPTVELSGTVTDPYLDLLPVDGAWVLIDTTDEQLSIRTGADGSFSMPGLPGDVPVSITVAAEDHMAVTYSGVVLSEVTMPLDLRTHQRSLDGYATESKTVTGTVTGAPSGSYVLFFGPTDAPSEDSYLAYTRAVGEEEASFEFSTVTWGGTEVVALEMDPEALVDLAVTTNAPSLDGELLDHLDPDFCNSIAIAHLGESMSTWSGYNRGCEDDDGGFLVDVGYGPGTPHGADRPDHIGARRRQP